MNSKIKVLIAVGGTGGHVFPGYNLAKHLANNDFSIELVTDKRGFKYLSTFKYFKISILPSYTISTNNYFTSIFSLTLIFFSVLRSLFYLIFNRPKIIFGMGGYASFPICIAAYILRIKFIIYENNLIIGKANKYLLPFTEKVLVSNTELTGIPNKFSHKIFKIGNIIKKEIIEFSKEKNEKTKTQVLSILILGGSQAAKIFADILPNIFLQSKLNGIKLKIFQHCLKDQNEKLALFYQKNDINYEIFNFSYNLVEYFSKVNLAITRSGSSMLAELSNANIPFISVPLPSSADNHQFKNAEYYQRKNLSFLIEEKDLNNELFKLLKEVNNNRSLLDTIIQNQRQYSDKNVYNNIMQVLNKIINEKN